MMKRIALIVWMATAIAHGSEAPRKLTVCVRGETVDRPFVRPAAQALAAKMFADIGISLEWRKWKPADESSQTSIVIELTSGTPENFKPGALGYATPHEGRHINVFLDRIGTMEHPEAVLAHVMAHEITHVLQGVCRHSATGLMKAHWTRHDLSEMRCKPLHFTQEDLILLYHGLATRIGSTDTPFVAR